MSDLTEHADAAPARPPVVYDAVASDRLALGAWRVMMSELWAFRELVHRLVMRNMAGQFRQSFLGYLWMALPPLATAFIFSMLRSAQIVQVPMPEGGMPYPLFALVGATTWGFFTQLSMGATASLASAGTLVSKVYFPREVLVFSTVGSAFMNLAVRMLVVVLTFLLFGYQPHPAALLAPLALIPVAFLAVGLGLLLAPVNTMMNDISRLLEFAFQFGLFLVPSVYPTPDPLTATTGWQHALYWMHTVNPVSHSMYAIQNLIEHGTFAWTTGFTFSCVVSVLLFLGAWRFFHVCEPLLAERL